MRPSLPQGLYAIADASLCEPVAWGTALAAAGCSVIQLRAKAWESSRVHEAATSLRATTAQYGALLIINDHPEIALEVGADGVHLGQDDADPCGVRRMLPDGLIGLSTHNIDQIRACPETVDYIGFGPVFSTQTKEQAGIPRGLDLLRQAVTASPLPVVAIGGITAANLAHVRATQTHSWAVASALHGYADAAGAIRAMHLRP